MKANEIEVGAIYERNSARYLGIGKRKMWTGDLSNRAPMVEKALVCIDENEYKGLIVKQDDDVIEGFWDEFKLVRNRP